MQLVYDSVSVDLDARRVTRGGHVVRLTPREAEVLRYLAERFDLVVPVDELQREVWELRASVRTKTVPVTLRRIRSKVGDPPLAFERGRGWRLEAPPSPDAEPPVPDTPLFPLPALRETWERRVEQGWTRCTLVGPPGIGKTRWASEFMAEEDDVLFLSLETHGPAQALARSLGTLSTESSALRLALGEQPRWLVFDGVEQSRDELRALLDVLRPSGNVRVLTTCRGPLGCQGESVIRIPALDAEQATDFLVSRLAQPEPDAVVAAAVQRSGGNPRVLEVAASHPLGVARWLDALSDSLEDWGLEASMQRAWSGLTPSARDLALTMAATAGPWRLADLARCHGQPVDEEMVSLLREGFVERSAERWRLSAVAHTFVAATQDLPRVRVTEWLLEALEEARRLLRTDVRGAGLSLEHLGDEWLALLRHDEPSIRYRALRALEPLLSEYGPLDVLRDALRRAHIERPEDPWVAVCRARLERTASLLPPPGVGPPAVQASRFDVQCLELWQTPPPPAPDTTGWPPYEQRRVQITAATRRGDRSELQQLWDQERVLPLRLYLCQGLSAACSLAGDHDGELAWAERLRDLTDHHGHRIQALYARDQYATALALRDPLQAEREWEELCDDATALGSPMLYDQGRMSRALLRWWLGDATRAWDLLDGVAHMSEVEASALHALRAVIAHDLGDADGALRHLAMVPEEMDVLRHLAELAWAWIDGQPPGPCRHRDILMAWVLHRRGVERSMAR